MYAVIELGGRQYRVSPEDTIEANRSADMPPGALTIDKVLLVVDGKNVSIGQPYVKGATVEAEIISATKGPKEIIFKFRRRKNMRRKTGHRQPLSLMKIKKINA